MGLVRELMGLVGGGDRIGEGGDGIAEGGDGIAEGADGINAENVTTRLFDARC